MVVDPNKVLGVSPGASQDEIKKAYRQKAKECHPDLHPDDPDATRKMNEINEAYDMLMHPEKYRAKQQQAQQTYTNQQSNPYGGGAYGGYGPYRPYGQQGGGWQYNGGWFDFDDLFGFSGGRQGESAQRPQEEPQDSSEIRMIIRALNTGRYQDAISMLVRIPSAGRNARWHYLFALAQQGAGNTMTAQEAMQRAVQMEPNNPLYHQLLQQYRRAGQAYSQRSQGFNMTAADPSRWCMGLCLANLFCNFCCRCF